jgi:type II secretory ATPase GspE/PulE/Tfp pilus assembly ATPase PilB-like protein
LGVNPNIIAPAINVSLAQRLVRKICNKCKEKYEPKKEEIEILKKYNKSAEYLWRGKGCQECNNFGYKGRIGIYEAILVDEKIEKVILERPSETEILKASQNQGILNMQQDGILKVLDGITTLEELGKVVEL